MEAVSEQLRISGAPVNDAPEGGTLRLRMWIENSGGVMFGLGRLLLLRKVAEAGSLKGAAEMLGMSYRAAWGKIKATEKVMGVKLIEKSSCNRAGYHLSPEGERLSRKYVELFNEVEQFALSKAESMFRFDLHGYGDEPGLGE